MKQHADPRMHTAEHILNQTMVRMFACGRAVSAHIERKKSKCDYRFARGLTPEERAEIERRVNEVIRANLPVREEWLSRAAAGAQFNLERLPESAGDAVRIVRVGDYDACPCSGEHASASGEIASFQIVSSTHAEGVLRVRFKIGAA